MKTLRVTLTSLALAGALAVPALALDNPLVVDLRGGHAGSATATMFQRGPIVLVNVTAGHGIPAHVAVTLNDGDCARPGGVAFALAPFSDAQSMTELKHSLADIAGKARSLVVHTGTSETSPALACGDVKG